MMSKNEHKPAARTPDKLPSAYEPNQVEKKIYLYWEKSGFFTADAHSGKDPFVIMIPPPNVTGALHMGHAVNNVLQDILSRWERMKGKEVLWLPGTDHAGIATQNVVEKEIRKEGLTRDDLGREAFIDRVWKWKAESGGTIINQLKRLGCSCDWSRERFTMDDTYCKAVRKEFVALYEKGLLYRGERIINWCPRCLTALSDIEAEQPDVLPQGKLYHLKYPVDGEEGRFLTVATTRPETMLGDTGVAVHPHDNRYSDLIGKHVRLPLMDRLIPIVADTFVDPEFGTGAVKVTPAHDQNDFECGERCGLERVVIMGPDGVINENGGSFQGQDRFDARESVAAAMDELGLLEKVEDYEVPVRECYRCHTVVEPYLSLQWFVSMRELAEPAIDAVKSGNVRFVPKRWENTYLDWMENIRDWCISRQIWWGHQIPVWYCADCEHVNVSMDDVTACEKCQSTTLTRDPDVLDTWFSSGLWPFATLGWPDETDDLKKFYPGSTLVTGRDIIYHWVARMVMTGLEFMGDKPFTDIVINPTIMDDNGKRQSKSLGTGVDPLELIDEFGADATRFSLAGMVLENQDIKFGTKLSRKKLEETRNFLNKVWNASRFVLMNLDGVDGIPGAALPNEAEDRWIRSRLSQTVQAYDEALSAYRFGDAVHVLYHFFWDEFCAWYIELTKPRLAENQSAADRASTGRSLVSVLDVIMRLLHPLVPHITEELWHTMSAMGLPLSDTSESIMLATWPEANTDDADADLDETFSFVQKCISGIRDVRNKMNILAKVPLSALISAPSERARDRLAEFEGVLSVQANLASLTIDVGQERPPRSSTVVVGDTEIYIPLEGVIDPEAERNRLEAKKGKLTGQLAGIRKKLGSSSFREKAPEDVVNREIERKESLIDQIEKIDAAIEELTGTSA
jgi:valyl-tRNA synthetase